MPEAEMGITLPALILAVAWLLVSYVNSRVKRTSVEADQQKFITETALSSQRNLERSAEAAIVAAQAKGAADVAVAQITYLKESNTRLEAEVARLNTRQTETAAAYESKIAAMETRITELQARVDELTKLLQAKQEEATDKDAIIADLREEIARKSKGESDA